MKNFLFCIVLFFSFSAHAETDGPDFCGSVTSIYPAIMDIYSKAWSEVGPDVILKPKRLRAEFKGLNAKESYSALYADEQTLLAVCTERGISIGVGTNELPKILHLQDVEKNYGDASAKDQIRFEAAKVLTKFAIETPKDER